MNRWLATRLAGQLTDKSASEEGRAPRATRAQPQQAVRKQVTLPAGPARSTKPRADHEDGEEAATRPGAPARQSAPLSTSMFGGRSEDSEEDPATVKADRHAIQRALADVDADPATVQRFRMPVSFVNRSGGSESVMDPETVFDNGDDPSHWRDDIDPHPHGHDDELPPGPLPSAVPDQSGPTLSRDLPSPPWGGIRSTGGVARHPEEPPESGVTVWIPILAGAAGAVLLLLLVLAWLAGSP